MLQEISRHDFNLGCAGMAPTFSTAAREATVFRVSLVEAISGAKPGRRASQRSCSCTRSCSCATHATGGSKRRQRCSTFPLDSQLLGWSRSRRGLLSFLLANNLAGSRCTLDCARVHRQKRGDWCFAMHCLTSFGWQGFAHLGRMRYSILMCRQSSPAGEQRREGGTC